MGVWHKFDGINTMAQKGEKAPNDTAPKAGSGGRFAALKSTLSHEKGVTNPGALAASIGRKKFGASKMAKWSAAGRKGC